MNYKLKFFIMLGCFFLTSCCVFANPSVRFDITVIDNEGKLVENAEAKFSFRTYNNSLVGWGTDTNAKEQIKKTDKKGFASAVGLSNWGEKNYVLINKEGFYETISTYSDFSEIRLNKLLNRWEPYPCELKVILKKKKNPVPMYQKSYGQGNWLKIPEEKKKIGFDLKVGDWVSPYGDGTVNDFYIYSYGTYIDNTVKYYVYISFDDNNGIFELTPESLLSDSEFKLPYTAPINDYKKELLLGETHNKTPSTGLIYDTRKKKSIFILRTRTKLDENNTIISANYTIMKNYDENSYIGFTYFFNPDNQSRSLEFNGKNLFKDLNAKGMKKERWEK